MAEKKQAWYRRHATALHVGLTMLAAGIIGVIAFKILYEINESKPVPENVDPAQHIYYLAGTVVFVLGILTAAGAAILQFRKQKSNEETVQNEKDKLKLAQKEAEYNWAITEQQVAENKRIADAQSEANLDAKYADRLARAIDHLGHGQESIRKGAIYELKLLARDSEKDRVDVVEILTSFVREKALEVIKARGAVWVEKTEVPAELPLALSVLSKLAIDYAGDTTSDNPMAADLGEIDFAGFDLENVRAAKLDITGANLMGANLMYANLQGADLMYANLQGADLQGARLMGADLMGANLMGANLQGAKLRFADLQGAELRFAKLRFADLRGALGLTKKQVESALFNKGTTKIDEGLWEEMFPGDLWPWGKDGEVDGEGENED